MARTRMRDLGEHGARARFRDGIRGEAAKVSQRVDQVGLGTVSTVQGANRVGVTFDGSRHNVTVGWAALQKPRVNQRVVVVGLAGGQEWWVIGAVNQHPIDQLRADLEALEARVAVLESL